MTVSYKISRTELKSAKKPASLVPGKFASIRSNSELWFTLLSLIQKTNHN